MKMRASLGSLQRPKADKLSAFDDVLTDLLVDSVCRRFLSMFVSNGHQVYYRGSIRKTCKTYPLSCEDHSGIISILQRLVIEQKNPKKALSALLELPEVKAVADPSTPVELEHFRRHTMKYLSIYLPACPFEICSTTQYKSVEAAIMARKSIEVGETIKFLCGTRAPLTEDEEDRMVREDNSFSILRSSRHGVALMLGPTRFLNHDCDANARLVADGKLGMAVIATRCIDAGEEITVLYDTDYFGDKCLCKTCKEGGLNGWREGDSLRRSPVRGEVATIKRKRAPSAPTSRKKSCRILPCQRTIRHKKIYGFEWPKTEKAGKHDEEERVYMVDEE
jgi:histone-lysine N-methyltransferase SUV420H